MGAPAITTLCALRVLDAAVTSLGDHQQHHQLHPTHTLDGEKKCQKTVKKTCLFLLQKKSSPEVSRHFRCTFVHKVLLEGSCKVPPLPPQPFPSRSRSASTSSTNIRRSINLVCVESCLRIHSQSEGSSSKTHRHVLPKCLPKVILLLHLSATCLSLDCRRPRRVGDTSSSRSRTFLRPLPSPPQRSHLQHLLRHLVAQSRDSLLHPVGSFPTSEANSSTLGH